MTDCLKHANKQHVLLQDLITSQPTHAEPENPLDSRLAAIVVVETKEGFYRVVCGAALVNASQKKSEEGNKVWVYVLKGGISLANEVCGTKSEINVKNDC